MKSVTFKGVHVTRDDVLGALERFRREYPRGDYDNWLGKDNYKYAIHHEKRCYPPKLIMAWAIGLPDTSNCGFSGGGRTNNPLEDLGFTIVP